MEHVCGAGRAEAISAARDAILAAAREARKARRQRERIPAWDRTGRITDEDGYDEDNAIIAKTFAGGSTGAATYPPANVLTEM